MERLHNLKSECKIDNAPNMHVQVDIYAIDFLSKFEMGHNKMLLFMSFFVCNTHEYIFLIQSYMFQLRISLLPDNLNLNEK